MFGFFHWIYRCRDGLILVATPLLLSPILFFKFQAQECRCAFVAGLMAIYWLFQPIPLPVTALLPVALFPLLGLASTEKACEPYLQSTNMLFMASLIIATAMENSGLHKRIAYRFLILIGNNVRSLFAGFMFVTMFLGVWIINTAATAMILPIADVVVDELFNNLNNNQDIVDEQRIEMINKPPSESAPHKKFLSNGEIHYSSTSLPFSSSKTTKKLLYTKRLLYICIAYSATIGGTSTLTSNGPNLVFQFVLDEFYQGQANIDYTNWLLFCLPATIISVSVCWILISIIYLRSSVTLHLKKSTRNVLIRKYQELGSISFHEVAVCSLFVVLVFLWMLRNPHFMTGWGKMLNNNIIPKDTTPAILIVILLFCIPSHPLGPFPSKPLLDWKTAQAKLAWGVILLRGGGFSLADTALTSGLTKYIGNELSKINNLPVWQIVVIITVIASFTTEFASNSAIASIFLPISGEIASELNSNPLFFLIPITLSCSYAFVLQVGTPANALVSLHAHLQSTDMIIPGLITKIVCLIIMFGNLYIFGVPLFDLDTPMPSWMNETFQNQKVFLK